MYKKLIAIALCLVLLCSLLAMSAGAATVSASATEIDELFTQRSQGVHPRVLMHEEDFTDLRHKVETDSYSKILYARIYEYALAQLDEPLCIYELPDGQRLLEISRAASKRIIWCSLVYKISGDRRFADRAIEEMLNVCAFSDWHPDHYLDVGQMAYGVGIGYDWLYHDMTSTQRSTIAKAIYNHAILSCEGKGFWSSHGNWNVWCHGGLTVAACAIYESYPAACSSYLSRAITSVQTSLNESAPLGSFPEGPGYYGVASEFTALFMDSLQSVLGTEFGLCDLQGMRESASYYMAINGYVTTFNYGDGSQNPGDRASLHWFAKQYNMPELSVYQRKLQGVSTDRSDLSLALLWYDPAFVEGVTLEESQTDYLLYSNANESVATFRSFNDDPRQIYAAIKSGYNNTSHSDMDIGTFVMEAMGERWFEELSQENYNVSGYWDLSDNGTRWNYYRKRAEGQNVYVLKPDKTGGQDHDARAQITSYESTYDGGFATVNMLDAYDSYGMTSGKRGILLFDNRSRVLLRDEIVCKSGTELYWFAHTKAEITLSADGKTATLTLNGKTLEAKIGSPSNAVFTVSDAVPLSTSPAPSGNNANTGIRKLVIHLTGISKANIAVTFTPIYESTDSGKSVPSTTIDNFSTLLSAYPSGTKLEPNKSGVYEIYTADQLCLFAETVNGGETFQGKTVRLMADIDLKNRNFTPIGGGGSSDAFKGTFDGNNHVIRNLLIFRSGVSNVGLFGRVESGTVKDLGIENGTVFCGGASAALVGVARNSILSGCFSRCNVVGNGSHIGGLIGQLEGTGTVLNCYNTGDITNSSSVSGGIVGYIASSTTATLENCYHSGKLSDSAGNCGLIGFYHTTNTTYLCKSVTVTNCYSTTPLKGSTVTDSTSIEHYTDSQVVSEGRLSSLAISLGDAYIYDCKWKNEGYPVFTWQEDTTLPSDLRLSTVEELRLLAYTVNKGLDDFAGKTVYLTKDIDLNSREWISIGGYDPLDTKGKIFKGTFDGMGHTVRNLKISDGLNYMGFFGSVDGTVRNFGIQSGSVSGQGKVAGLAGYARGTIENCFNRASVYGTEAVGGLVGMASKLTVTDCYNNASVSSPGTVGGVIGYFSSGAAGATVTNTYHVGTLTGSSKGGICCSLNAKVTDTVFTNCYTLDSYPIVQSGTAHEEIDCALLSPSDLKSSYDLLGSAFMTDSVRTTNGGYPRLRVFAYGFTVAPTLPTDASGAYCIYTAQDLRTLAYLVNVEGQTFSGRTVKLCNDINLESKEWIPIGGEVVNSVRSRFSGTFDGQGHVIYNLTISSGNDYAGLFGYVNKGKICNLGIGSGMILGGSAVGSVAGRLTDNASIRNCYTKISVSGKNNVATIAGLLSGKNVTIENCYTTGSAVGNSGVGSVAGSANADSTNLLVQNCYYVGTMDQPLLGKMGDSTTTDMEMSNCYSTGEGALITTPNGMTVTDSSRKTEAELRLLSRTLGTAFAEDYLVQNDLFPVLAWENGDCPTALTLVDGVYEIGSSDELRLLSYLVRKGTTFSKKKIALTTNIDLENIPFMAIGGTTDGTHYYFKGQFDGRGHVIRNLYVKDMKTGRVGLFGLTNGATIENVGIESGTVIGYTQAAGIAGYINTTTIRSCYNKATVYGNSKAAGIAGALAGPGQITDCYNAGLVLAEGTDKNTGGIFGNAADSTKYILQNCYNIATHNGIGGNVNAPVVDSGMKNCYTTGSANLLRKIYNFAITDSSVVSADTLRGYASVLGSGYVADTAGINNGYPVLAWEMGSLEESLFFDFTDSTSDRSRYDAGVYGWRNFDDPSQWFRSDVKIDSVVTNTDTGDLIITAKTTIDDSVWPDLYVDTAIDGANKTFPLNYNPDQAEFFQIRFRMKDLRVGTTVKEGETKESTVSPYIRLTGYGRDMTSISATSSYTYLGNYLNSDEYITVTLPISDAFREAEVIGRLRVYLGGVESIEGTQGTFTIDYIYVGPEKDLPAKAYQVDFVNHDGTVLQTTYVSHGETAVYYGSTPKKAKDDTAHYTFKDWDKVLANITAKTTLTAQFTAQEHTYTYKTADAETHKATCTCGYNKTESHTYSYSATKKPTTSATGTLTGICSACSGTTTVTLPKLTTTDYTKTTAKAPTCTATGTDQYTWRVTNYGSFSFNVTTKAKGHTEVVDPAVPPTCTATGLAEGKHCSVCNEILTPQTTVAAKGHIEVIDKAVAATCTATGLTEGKYCSECNAILVAQKTVAMIDHSYAYKATKNPTASATGTLTGTCSACSGTTTVTLPKLTATDYTKTTTKAPTCTATGTDKYTWKVTTYGSFSFNVTTKAKRHTEVVDAAVAPTCTATGLTEGKHCSVCNEILTPQTTVAATGHTEVIDKAIAPTCTATGLTEGKHCSVCNAVLTAQTTVAALGHGYTSVVTPPTCTDKGYTTHTCSRCAHSYRDSTTKATGHNYDAGVITTVPTLKAEGIRTFTCRNDHAHIKTESIEKLSESLLFTFDNGEVSRNRYENYAYGERNYDDPTQWFTTSKKIASVQTQADTGEIILTTLTSIDDSLWPDVYLDTAIDGANKTFPLNYDPDHAEFFQIRFRLKNFRLGTTIAEGETKESVISPYIRLSGYGRDMTSISGTAGYTYLKPYLDSDEYITVTLPIGEDFRNADVIGRIRVYLGGVESIEGTQGIMTIDYIYVGPEKGLPTNVHQVDFVNHDGTPLQSTLVPHGEHAVYYGNTPKKTRDDICHYTFNGWDKPLENITADTPLTAQFTSTPHSFTYKSVNEESHKSSCSCGYSKTEAHTYVGGNCPCGAVEVKDPIRNTAWKMGHTLNLASDISVNLAVSKSLLAGYDMETVYVLAEVDAYEGNEKTGTKTIKIDPVEQGDYYYFTLTGLTAVHMNDRIRSVLYGTKDGQVYFSATDDYSITDYAYSQMNKANMPRSLKILCADLLRYGAKAQIFKSYRTDNLADAAMTDDHKAFLSDIDTVTFGNTNTVLNDHNGATVTWAGKALDLNSKVILKFIINPTNYKGNVQDLSLRLTFASIGGETKTVILKNAELYNADRNYYSFSFDGLLAAELRTVVSAQVYAGNTPVSATLQYSADTYGNNKTGTLGDLCKALFAYSDSAKNYFI